MFSDRWSTNLLIQNLDRNFPRVELTCCLLLLGWYKNKVAYAIVYVTLRDITPQFRAAYSIIFLVIVSLCGLDVRETSEMYSNILLHIRFYPNTQIDNPWNLISLSRLASFSSRARLAHRRCLGWRLDGEMPGHSLHLKRFPNKTIRATFQTREWHSIESWLVRRDPGCGWWLSLYNWIVWSPT